jgi:hypothetical protein
VRFPQAATFRSPFLFLSDYFPERLPLKVRRGTARRARLTCLAACRLLRELPPSSGNQNRQTLHKNSADLKSFRINTCKTVSKQRALSFFGMNTYEKPGGRGSYCKGYPHYCSRFIRPLRPRKPARITVWRQAESLRSLETDCRVPFCRPDLSPRRERGAPKAACAISQPGWPCLR